LKQQPPKDESCSNKKITYVFFKRNLDRKKKAHGLDIKKKYGYQDE